ncbi:MAG: hypothetical protein HC883_04745 [Bdellovibrionaceae bacterium]|nr:hypothetical protein [Pseudobdellovibrionaceae bacterium]
MSELKKSSLRFVLPVLLLLSIPAIYNSCQGGLLGAKGFSSKSYGLTCKVAMENGTYTKIEFNSEAPASIFAGKKVRLREDLESSSVQAKASGPVLVEAGQSLGVLLNNRCLQVNRDTLNATTISKSAVASAVLIPGLDRQAFEWILDRDYTDAEIEALAATESCVEGISWNKTYKMQAAFSDSGMVYQNHLASIRAMASYDLFYNTVGGMDLAGPPVILAVIDTAWIGSIPICNLICGPTRQAGAWTSLRSVEPGRWITIPSIFRV